MASNDEESHLLVKIGKTCLTRNFEGLTGGKMDLYAIVTFLTSEGDSANQKKITLGRTKTLWNTGMSAEWDYICKSQVFSPDNVNSIQVSVYEDNHVLKATLCGTSTVLDLGKLDLVTKKETEFVDLPLFLDHGSERTGNVGMYLWSVTTKIGEEGAAGSITTKTIASPDDFGSPVERLGVSGGTAPFFKLEYKGEDIESKSPSFYIGKDLSRATDEIVFYETLLQMKKDGSVDTAINESMHDFTFDYAGVLSAKEIGQADDVPELELLCLRNLYDGVDKLRLLDIKMGQRTASANWQGKSRARAMKQQLLDGWTNSSAEGFRLEGFDGPPPSLETMNPLLDTGYDADKTYKKALRFMFQRFPGRDIMMYLLDTHQEPAEHKDDFDLNKTLSASEYAELVLHEMVARMTKLCIACHYVPTPQKWIGSSVALGYDSGKLPSREADQEAIRKQVICSIFDWGRSELNTISKHNSLSNEEQKDRCRYWKYYTGGIDRLAYDTANLYYNRFDNTVGWKRVTFYIYDYDSVTADDFIGKLSVDVEETDGIVIAKLTKRSTTLVNKVAKSTIQYSIKLVAYPASSRLLRSWRITVHRCDNLPSMDSSITKKAASDPYCVLSAESKDAQRNFSQQSSVIPNEMSPVWNESFDLPVAKANTHYLAKALGPEIGKSDYASLFGYPAKKKSFSTTIRKGMSKKLMHSSSQEELSSALGTDESFSDWCNKVAMVKMI